MLPGVVVAIRPGRCDLGMVAVTQDEVLDSAHVVYSKGRAVDASESVRLADKMAMDAMKFVKRHNPDRVVVDGLTKGMSGSYSAPYIAGSIRQAVRMMGAKVTLQDTFKVFDYHKPGNVADLVAEMDLGRSIMPGCKKCTTKSERQALANAIYFFKKHGKEVAWKGRKRR